jgi:hypothetical protein
LRDPLNGSADEHWLQRWWRPAMAWQYFVVCLCDFVVFPVVNAAAGAALNGRVTDWHPLTLQGGGLYHMAMGAVIGVTAWQRTQEKLATFGAFGGEVSSTDTDRVAPAKSSRAD